MELILAAAAFTAWHALVFLPPDALALRPGLGPVRGTGLRLLNPWPSAVSAVAAPLPVRVEPDALVAEGPLGRFGATRAADAPRRIAWEAVAPVGHAGERVRAGGRRLLRATSAAHAGWLAALVARLAAAPSEARARELDRVFEAGFDLERLREACRESRRGIRALGWACDLEALLLFVAAPAAMLAMGEEEALRALLAPLAAVHAGALLALWHAHRRLGPERRGERAELLLVAALFPPALLRAPQELHAARLAPFHPLAVAAASLDRDGLRDLLARELVRLERAPRGSPALDRRLDRERAGLLALAGAREIPPESLSAPRVRPEPGGVRYCPLCLEDFRPGVERCSDCGGSTRAYADAAPA